MDKIRPATTHDRKRSGSYVKLRVKSYGREFKRRRTKRGGLVASTPGVGILYVDAENRFELRWVRFNGMLSIVTPRGSLEEKKIEQKKDEGGQQPGPYERGSWL